MLFGFALIATVLSLSSAAFACTVYKGKLTLQGDQSTSTVTAVGNNSNMGYCSISNSYAYANDVSGRVKVTVAPASTCLVNGSNKLPATTSTLKYAVTYISYAFNNSSMVKDCMAVGGDAGTTKIGDITIDSNGNGGGVWYNLPSPLPIQNGSPYEAGVCVSDTKYSPSLYGIQAPLVVI